MRPENQESMQEAMEADGAEGWTEMRAVEGTTAAAVVADAGDGHAS